MKNEHFQYVRHDNTAVRQRSSLCKKHTHTLRMNRVKETIFHRLKWSAWNDYCILNFRKYSSSSKRNTSPKNNLSERKKEKNKLHHQQQSITDNFASLLMNFKIVAAATVRGKTSPQMLGSISIQMNIEHYGIQAFLNHKICNTDEWEEKKNTTETTKASGESKIVFFSLCTLMP